MLNFFDLRSAGGIKLKDQAGVKILCYGFGDIMTGQ